MLASISFSQSLKKERATIEKKLGTKKTLMMSKGIASDNIYNNEINNEFKVTVKLSNQELIINQYEVSPLKHN